MGTTPSIGRPKVASTSVRHAEKRRAARPGHAPLGKSIPSRLSRGPDRPRAWPEPRASGRKGPLPAWPGDLRAALIPFNCDAVPAVERALRSTGPSRPFAAGRRSASRAMWRTRSTSTTRSGSSRPVTRPPPGGREPPGRGRPPATGVVRVDFDLGQAAAERIDPVGRQADGPAVVGQAMVRPRAGPPRPAASQRVFAAGFRRASSVSPIAFCVCSDPSKDSRVGLPSTTVSRWTGRPQMYWTLASVSRAWSSFNSTPL